MLIKLSFVFHPVYQDIYTYINNKYGFVKNNCDIMINGIPIMFNDEYFILLNYSDIDISGLEITKFPYKIQYIINEVISNEIIINNIYNIRNCNTILQNNDCVYDELTNIMFIKFYNSSFDYYKISNSSTDENIIINNLFYGVENEIKYIWTDDMFKKNILISNNNKIMFENKFINLPKIPLIISKFDIEEENNTILLPITGSVVLDNNDNFLGIVSYSNIKNVATIPVIVIQNLLAFKPIFNINFNVSVINIVINDSSIINYALCKDGSHKKIITKINNKKINEKGMININDKFLPLCSYLWLFNNNNNICVDIINNNKKIIKKDNLQILKINNLDEYSKIEIYHDIIELQNIKNNTLSITDLNFLKYDKIYIIEMNEKIMQILKHVFQTTDDFNYLYDHIIKHKFSKNKIIVSINNNLEIKIIKKINNKNIHDIKNIKQETDIEKLTKYL